MCVPPYHSHLMQYMHILFVMFCWEWIINGNIASWVQNPSVDRLLSRYATYTTIPLPDAQPAPVLQTKFV